MELTDHRDFFKQAAHFKEQALDHGGFTDAQITAMLGSYVLICYRLSVAGTPLPPEFAEMMVKQNALSDRYLAQMAEDDD